MRLIRVDNANANHNRIASLISGSGYKVVEGFDDILVLKSQKKIELSILKSKFYRVLIGIAYLE